MRPEVTRAFHRPLGRFRKGLRTLGGTTGGGGKQRDTGKDMGRTFKAQRRLDRVYIPTDKRNRRVKITRRCVWTQAWLRAQNTREQSTISAASPPSPTSLSGTLSCIHTPRAAHPGAISSGRCKCIVGSSRQPISVLDDQQSPTCQ